MLLGYAYPRDITGHPTTIRLSRIVSTFGRGFAIERLGTVTSTTRVRVGEFAVTDAAIGIVTAGLVGDAVLIFGARRDFETTRAAGLAQDGLKGQKGHCNENLHSCGRIEALVWFGKDTGRRRIRHRETFFPFASQMGIYMSALEIVSESPTDEYLRRVLCHVLPSKTSHQV